MGEFCGKDDLPTVVVDKGNPGGLAPWIKLDPKRLSYWHLDALFENEREGVAAQDCRLAR